MEENCQELPGNFLFGLVRKQGKYSTEEKSFNCTNKAKNLLIYYNI